MEPILDVLVTWLPCFFSVGRLRLLRAAFLTLFGHDTKSLDLKCPDTEVMKTLEQSIMETWLARAQVETQIHGDAQAI